jgi:hypothetical protein
VVPCRGRVVRDRTLLTLQVYFDEDFPSAARRSDTVCSFRRSPTLLHQTHKIERSYRKWRVRPSHRESQCIAPRPCGAHRRKEGTMPYYKGVVDDLIEGGHQARDVAARLLSLRHKPSKELPPRKVIPSLLMAMWNIREFGRRQQVRHSVLTNRSSTSPRSSALRPRGDPGVIPLAAAAHAPTDGFRAGKRLTLPAWRPATIPDRPRSVCRQLAAPQGPAICVEDSTRMTILRDASAL